VSTTTTVKSRTLKPVDKVLYRPILCLLVKLPHSVEAAVDADRRLEALVDAQLLLPLLTEAALDRACCGVHVDFSESDSGEFAAELDTAARTREIETQRQQAASSLDVNPGDLTLDEQNNQFELTEEARRSRRRSSTTSARSAAVATTSRTRTSSSISPIAARLKSRSTTGSTSASKGRHHRTRRRFLPPVTHRRNGSVSKRYTAE